MSHKTVEHTGTFSATDKDGAEYTILEFTEFHEGHSSSGPYRVEGLKFLRTDDGRNRVTY